MGFVCLDEVAQRLHAKVGERHNAVVAGPVDPDQSIFLIHFVSDVPEPVLIFAEHCRHAGDGDDVVDFVGRRHGQAAWATATSGLGFQFQGSNSSSR